MPRMPRRPSCPRPDASEALRWPAGEGIRVDAWIAVGTEIGSRFDPMLAKIIAHGERPRRRRSASSTRALDETLVLGVVTNLRFLRWLVRQPVVLAGEARTDTLDRILGRPTTGRNGRPCPADAWRTAAAALGSSGSPGLADPWADGWRLNAGSVVRLETGDVTQSVTITPPDDPLGSVVVREIAHVDIGGRSVAFRLAAPPDVDRAARAALGHAGHGGSADVIAPMPGAVLGVHLAVGALVTAGDPVVTLEAMKMEHTVVAPFDGVVSAIAIRPGDQVTRGQTLATVES